MRRGRVVLIATVVAVVAALVALARTEAGQFVLSGGSFTRSVDVDRGTYFRLKVKLAYKGEPQDFDIVVGCNVRVTTYRDNSSTYEAGLIPTVFGRRMSDGAAVVVRPPNACDGETTANGGVPAEFIPLIIVYDDADTLGFGTAYVTADAYSNPLAPLKFSGATIEKATRAEFDIFRVEQPNVVRPEMYFADSSPELDERGLSLPSVMYADVCFGYARFRLIGEQRAAAQRLWPTERPRFWRPTTEELAEIDPGIPNSRIMQSDHDVVSRHSRQQFLIGVAADADDYGVPTHSGAGLLKRREVYPASVYPDIGGWGHLPWPSDPTQAAERIFREGPRIGASIDYRDGSTRGFSYCRSNPEDYPTSQAGNYSRPEIQHFLAMPGRDLVDGEEVLVREWKGHALRIIERDEFIFYRFLIFIDSTRGDV